MAGSVARPRRDHATRSVERPAPARKGRRRSASWVVPAALIALSLIPVLAGSLRLVQLSGGPEAVPAQARFDASPAPVVTHVASAIVGTAGSSHALLMGAGWAINLAFAELIIRKRPGRGPGRVVAGGSHG